MSAVGRYLILIMLLGWAAVAAAETAIEFPERARQGDLLMGRAPPGSHVEAGGHRIAVGEHGRFVVGLDRDAPDSLEVRIERPSGEVVSRRVEVASRDYAIERIDGLPEDKVSPRSEETLNRIRREAALVSRARQRNDERSDFLTGWRWPATGRVSGVYGSQRILNGKPRQPHYGVDIAVPAGTPVHAPADGVVSLVHEGMFFSGATLMLDHGQGLSSTFLHLQRIQVAEGERVARGDVIATVGASGRATGPHLDWRMSWFDRRVDPTQLVSEMPESP
jgi:murein DD-endopeptidase MepM/ murein hydrolase activator NlpD